jgi:hypothetical protein
MTVRYHYFHVKHFKQHIFRPENALTTNVKVAGNRNG